jgi:Zn-dependent peptidase ImmA (M78 family)
MKDIREVIHNIKELLGIQDLLRVPLVFLLDNVLPGLFPDYKFLIVSKDDLGKGQYAYTSHIEKVMKIREDVYMDACNGIARALFTIAHELGHLFLHDREGFEFSRLEMTVPPYMRAEWQANYFAAEFLMPSKLILDMTEEEIVENCNVSQTAARLQLKHAIAENARGKL